jgi:hypothetical protein
LWWVRHRSSTEEFKLTDVQALDPQMIQRYLRGHDLKFAINQNGRFIVQFYGEDMSDYRVVISVDDTDARILTVVVVSETPYPRTLRAQAEAFVSHWNRLRRWPKAYLEDDQHARGFWIVGENYFPLRAGVHQALLTDLLDISISAGRQLLHASASALDGPEGLHTWLRHAG